MGVGSDPLLGIEEVGGGSPIPLSSTEKREDTDREALVVDLKNNTYSVLCTFTVPSGNHVSAAAKRMIA